MHETIGGSGRHPGGAGTRGQPRAGHDADLERHETAIEVGHRRGLAIGPHIAGIGRELGEGGTRLAVQGRHDSGSSGAFR